MPPPLPAAFKTGDSLGLAWDGVWRKLLRGSDRAVAGAFFVMPTSFHPQPKSSDLQPVVRALPARAGGASCRDELAAVVEFSNDAIFTRAIDGTITTWNAAAERIFGHSAAEMVGRSGRRLLPPGRQDEFRDYLERLGAGEVVPGYETERRHKDGRPLWVSLTLSPLRDAAKRLTGFSTIARDVTEELRARGTLQRQERELQDLFDEASVGLVLVARDGTILRANRAFSELLHLAPGQIAGCALADFHVEPATVKPLLDRLAARQTLHNFPAELRGRHGQSRHVLMDANVFWEKGRFVHSRWFVRDISRRKQLERELLELSEHERRGFAQELHDGLGQQLGGIAYLSNVLQEKLAERRAPEAGEAKRIFGLVRDAIEQTRRISRGLSPIRPEPEGLMTALRELAAQTTELFRVRCRFLCPQPVWIEDSSLASHFYRIAQEAVNNALKHARPRRIDIQLRRRPDQFLLSIKDDGKGIGEISPQRQGLGLHIMQYRAGLVRGSLTVRPRRRRGTEVTFAVTKHAPNSEGRVAKTTRSKS
jgi:PAS domain S-box-containing protein